MKNKQNQCNETSSCGQLYEDQQIQDVNILCICAILEKLSLIDALFNSILVFDIMNDRYKAEINQNLQFLVKPISFFFV